jgi:hypothetical protein
MKPLAMPAAATIQHITHALSACARGFAGPAAPPVKGGWHVDGTSANVIAG